MPEEKFDGQERARRAREAAPEKLSDSILDQRERAKRFAAEAAQRGAEQVAQEQHQRDRQARHQEEARRVDEETRAALFLRVMQAREGAKPSELPPPVPLSTERQDEQLELEQAAGRRMLEKYAKRRDEIAAARDRNRAEEKTGEDTTPGFKT